MAVFFGRCAGDFTFIRDESLFELLDLLVILDDLTLDLRHDIFARLWYVLLGSIHRVEEWVRLFSFQRCARNLWSTLHF